MPKLFRPHYVNKFKGAVWAVVFTTSLLKEVRAIELVSDSDNEESEISFAQYWHDRHLRTFYENI